MGLSSLKTSLCESCYYSVIATGVIMKPRFAFSRKAEPFTVLNIYCNKLSKNVQKFMKVKECAHYRPKKGKIGKKVYQTGLDQIKNLIEMEFS